MTTRPSAPPTVLLGLFLLILAGGLGWIALREDPADRSGTLALGVAPEEPVDGEGSLRRGTERETRDDGGATSGNSRRAIVSEVVEDPTVAAAFEDGVEFRGLVLAALGEEPLAGAIVHLEGDDWEVDTESGADGTFQTLVPELRGLRLRTTLAGYAPHLKTTDGTQDEIQILLRQEGRIVGNLRGPALDDPAKGRAELWDLNIPGSAVDEPLATAEIDEKGRFEFGELRTSEYLVCVTYPGCRLSHIPHVAVETGEVTEVTLEPQAGATLTGEVLELDTGEPVPGAVVRARLRFASIGRIGALSTVEATTDAEGRYQIDGLIQAEHRVQVTAPWGTVVNANVPIYESQEEVEEDFELSVPGSVAGTVMNAQDLGIGGALVTVAWEEAAGVDPEDLSPGQGAGQESRTADPNGLFSFDGLPTGRQLFLTASRPAGSGGEALQTRPVLLMLRPGKDREGLELRVEGTHSALGLVLDPSSRPVANVEIEVFAATRGGGRKGSKPREHSVVTTDLEGRFQVDGLVTGTYELVLSHGDFLPNTKSLRIKADRDPNEVTRIGLHEREFLSGYVENELYEAVPYAQITVRDVAPQEGKKKRNTRTLRADGYGRFLVDNITAGDEFGVRAKAAGHEPSNVEERVVIPYAGELRFELRTSPQIPRSTVIGRLQRRDGGELERVKVRGLRGGSITWNGDAFEVAGVRSGPLSATFEAKDCLSIHSGKLNLAPGGTLNLGTLFLSPAAELFVFVREKGGKPMDNFRARLVPLDAIAKDSGLKEVKLGTKRVRHRFKGTKNRAWVQSGHSSQVPYGTWRLEVRAKGMGLMSKKLTFSSAKSTVRTEALVERPKPRNKGKKNKKPKKPKNK